MVLELLGIAGGGALLLYLMRGSSSPAPEQSEPEPEQAAAAPELPEQQPEPTEPTPHPDTENVVNEVTAARNAVLYGRVRGKLERIQHIQTELDSVEKMLIHTESYYIQQNDGLEKRLTLSTPWGGEESSYTLDLKDNDGSRTLALNLLKNRRDYLRMKLVKEVQQLPTALQGTATGAGNTDLHNLKAAVNAALTTLERGA